MLLLLLLAQVLQLVLGQPQLLAVGRYQPQPGVCKA